MGGGDGELGPECNAELTRLVPLFLSLPSLRPPAAWYVLVCMWMCGMD